MKTLDKGVQRIDEMNIEPKEGQRRLLSSNKVNSRCSSLRSNNPLLTKEMLLDQLTDLLIDIYFQ
ncbi:MAG: hypothetical protein RJA07_2650 [Bacteroidota bacterium]|jgi:hypothetical protein